jgi:Fe-S oxidoreductase
MDKNRTTENCNLCGACNLNCPVHAILKKETAGPRFKAFLEKKKSLKEIFFLCTECGSCVQDCPANIEIDCLKARKELVQQGHETKNNKVMRDNIKDAGNPFGISGPKQKNQKINRYYT